MKKKITTLSPSLKLGKNVQIDSETIELGSNVQIADNVVIRGRTIRLGENVQIEQDTVILSETLEVGCGSRIEARCQIAAMRGPARHIRIGEQSVFAHDSKLLVPIGVLGDYCSIQNHCLLNGRKALVIGHNAWVGQNCILNSEDFLTIGNNFGIGSFSSVFTHGYFGDLLEGCQVFKIAPVSIEDDVWMVGSSNVVSPGVRIGAKAMVLTGSIVTKDVPSNHAVGGSPARDMTDRLMPYKPISSVEKLELMKRFVREFLEEAHPGDFKKTEDGYRLDSPYGPCRILLVPEFSKEYDLSKESAVLVFAPNGPAGYRKEGVTFFNLCQRTYTRTRSPAEIEMIKFLRSYRARFVPTDQPKVSVPA